MRILVGYDGSEPARAALSDLRFAGLPSRATAIVLSAVDVWLPAAAQSGGMADETLPGLKELRETGERAIELQRAIAKEGARHLAELFPGWRVVAEAVADSPGWALIKRAEGLEGGVLGERADLVVVGSHGHGGVKRAILGSVSHRVVTEVRCSVRVGRARPERSSGSPVGEGGSPPRILIGVDGSADSREAVQLVAKRTWPEGTQVLVASCDPGPYPGLDWYGRWSGGPASTEAREPVSGFRARIVEECAELLQAHHVGISVASIIRNGDPKHVLIRAAEEREGGTDCIFVGARGLRRLERFVLGSVSTSVAMNAGCSVEIVHPRRAPEEKWKAHEEPARR